MAAYLAAGVAFAADFGRGTLNVGVIVLFTTAAVAVALLLAACLAPERKPPGQEHRNLN
jgi:hypothetical protein